MLEDTWYCGEPAPETSAPAEGGEVRLTRINAGESRFEQLVSMLPVAVYSCEAPSGVISYFNQHATKLWGREPKPGDTDERFCGSYRLWYPNGDLLPHDQTPMALALREGRTYRNQEVVIEKPDGLRLTVLVNIDPIRNADGRVVAAINAFYDVTDQRVAQGALKESEQRFRTLADAAPVLIWMSGPNKEGVYFNQSWLDHTGKPMDAQLGEGWLEFVHPEDRQQLFEACQQAFLGRKGFTAEFRLRCANGEYRWMLDSGAPRFDPNGAFLGFVGSCTDITDRKAAEVALRESEERFRTLADAVPTMVWACRPDGYASYVNPRWIEYTGQKPEEALGFGWAETLHPDDRPRVLEQWGHCRRTGDTYEGETRYRRHDGEYRWHYFRGLPIRGNDGTINAWYGTSLDIHDKKLTEQALRARDAELELIAKATPVILTRCSRDLRFVYVNRAAAALFDQTPEQIMGRPMLDVMGSEAFAMIKPHVDRVLRGEPVEYESEIPYPTGPRWMSVNYMPERDDRGAVIGWVASIVDISARKRHEEQMRVAMAELNHRVKNSIATIDAIAQQTLENTSDLSEFRSKFGARLRSMAAAHSLLTRAKWKGAQLRDILLAELGPRVPSPEHLILDGPAVLVKPEAALALHMAIHELATNASKYGSLSVPRGRVKVTWKIANHQTELNLKLIWKEQDGPPAVGPRTTGFGSQLIGDIVEYELSGALERHYESDGMRCDMAIPLAAIGSVAKSPDDGPPVGAQVFRADARATSQKPESRAYGLRILVVEDNSALARLLERLLESIGCTVVGPAANLDSAVALAHESTYDAALLDVDLNGERVYPLARDLTRRNVPFALLTGYNVCELPDDLAGRTVFSKPVGIDVLTGWIEHVASIRDGV